MCVNHLERNMEMNYLSLSLYLSRSNACCHCTSLFRCPLWHMAFWKQLQLMREWGKMRRRKEYWAIYWRILWTVIVLHCTVLKEWTRRVKRKERERRRIEVMRRKRIISDSRCGEAENERDEKQTRNRNGIYIYIRIYILRISTKQYHISVPIFLFLFDFVLIIISHLVPKGRTDE